MLLVMMSARSLFCADNVQSKKKVKKIKETYNDKKSCTKNFDDLAQHIQIEGIEIKQKPRSEK